VRTSASHRFFALLTAAALLPAAASAQYAPADRFELGRRLHALESAWDEQADPAARKRAIPFLNTATRSFLFTFRVEEIGRDLDRARFALHSAEEPGPDALWAESLAVRPGSRLLDVTTAELPVALTSFYAVKGSPCPGARLRLTLCGGDGRPALPARETAVRGVPSDAALPLAGAEEGDYTLRAEILAGGKVLARREQTVSLAGRVGERLRRLQDAVKDWPGQPADADRETVRGLVKVLAGLQRGETQETDYPAARLLAEAEGAVTAVSAGKRYYGSPRVGQFWLTVPLKKGAVPLRQLAPEAARRGKPLPLVIALHGAGGSENMFFDAYGRGAIVRLCEERGWLLAAPRGSLLSMTPPLAELIGAVGRLYPVDTERVFVVGHSLGAIQAVTVARQAPQAFAGVAALAGGVPVDPGPALRDLPFFIGTGKEDPILRTSGRALVDSLERAGVKAVVSRTYEDAEHLTVVEAALPDVFAFFDKAARK
jgi:predicted esterase